MERITSTGNKLIREVRDLEKKARARRESGLFIAEGERLCSEIPVAYIERIFVADDYDGRLPEFAGEVSHDAQNAKTRAEAGANAAQASSHPLQPSDISGQRNHVPQRAPKIFQVPRELMEHIADHETAARVMTRGTGSVRTGRPRSLTTLIASPCFVTPRFTRMPIDAILRSSTQTPTNSADSSAHRNDPSGGFVPIDHVVGRALLITWPFDRWTWLDNYEFVFKGVDDAKGD